MPPYSETGTGDKVFLFSIRHVETKQLENDNRRLTRAERLRGEIRVNSLFAEGHSFVVYPFRVVFRTQPPKPVAGAAFLVSIPKRNFKRAVKRNLLKRRIREAFRLHKTTLNDTLGRAGMALDMAILYLDKEVLPYEILAKQMRELLARLSDRIASEMKK